MRFADIIGQQEIKEKLIGSFHNNRVSHSYLFYGIPGVGKLALAIAFAQYLSCDNKQETDSCGECPSCKKYNKLIHPDLHFVFPVVTGKHKEPISDHFIEQWRERVLESPYFSYRDWLFSLESEKKQGSIFVHEASSILRKLNLKTYESDYKAMIIWLPEKMNNSCANKLLKILEEPPEKTVFILVSDNRENVLGTILSRTQPVKILGIDNLELKNSLILNYDINDSRANDIVSISNGSMVEARNQLNTSGENNQYFENFVSLMRISYARNIKEAIHLCDELTKLSLEKQKGFLNYCLVLLRENFVYNQNQKEILYMTKEESSFSDKFAKFVNSKNIDDLFKIFNNAHYHIERNVNPKIVFTDTAFEIMKVIRR